MDHAAQATSNPYRRSLRLANKHKGLEKSTLQKAQELMCKKLKLAKCLSKPSRSSPSMSDPTTMAHPEKIEAPLLMSSHQHTNTKEGIYLPKKHLEIPLSMEEVQKIRKECEIMDDEHGPPTLQILEGRGDAPTECGTLDVVGTRGGLLTAWNPSLFECIDEWSGHFSLNVVLKRKVDEAVVLISNIYGPTCNSLKAAFFNELRYINTRSRDVWAALGDFNVLLFVHDKNKATSNISEILQFGELINDIGLLDVPLLNRSFTWSNGRRNHTLERLDCELISNSWRHQFPNSALRALPRPTSDHTPLILSAYTFIPSASLFRFETFWLRYPIFLELSGLDATSRLAVKINNVQGP
uniref:Endonuclease/exonuclease/phosphatase domain-containing protein n=1 Tax=Ananas comosus var. bracteatus TaxID=296719 RepID=A0A6V7Q6I0_ANACO|nr:unnamed protein product [Ananas comosus var. bracteatus]